MAQDFQSKTEAPTPRRREEARKQGDVALSRDLVSGFGLLAAVLVFHLLGPQIGAVLARTLRAELSAAAVPELTETHVVCFARAALGILVQTAGVLVLGLAIVHVLVTVLQTGVFVTLEPLKPKWERLSPVKGWNQLWSNASINRGAQAVIKTTILVVVLVLAARSQREQLTYAPLQPLHVVVATAWHISLRASFVVGIALVVAGGFDYGFQKWRHESQLRMTREELKEEQKMEEGDPLLRARIRRVQRDLAKQRMLRDVPSATVVVTNPTHYAVAMKYQMGQEAAPRVVAKGVDAVALHIRRIAERHEVPVLERPAVARSLYRMVEVGDEIPPELYHAVSEIIAFLYRSGRFN